MEGLVIDLVLVLFAIGGGMTGLGFLRAYLRKEKSKDPIVQNEELEAKGEHNAVEHELEEQRRCGACSEHTDPNVDLYVMGTWFHKKCYKVN